MVSLELDWLEGMHLKWGSLESHPLESVEVVRNELKGAYLNGYLKETVYMCQPEGFDNGTNCVSTSKNTIWIKTIWS